MITMAFLRELPDQERLNIENALMTLAQQKVFLIATDQKAVQLAKGFTTEDPDSLVVRINEFRVESRLVRGLHELGVELIREKGV